jgi:hypothetical protein
LGFFARKASDSGVGAIMRSGRCAPVCSVVVVEQLKSRDAETPGLLQDLMIEARLRLRSRFLMPEATSRSSTNLRASLIRLDRSSAPH